MNQAPQKPMPLVQMQIMSAALHFSILIYVFVAFFLANSSPGWVIGWVLKEENRILLYVFAAASVTTGSLALLIPKVMKGPLPQASTPHEVVESPLFFDFSNITPQVQTLTIVRMAFAESIAIFGLVLSMLNQASHWILPFAAAGLLLQVLVGPFGRFLRGV